MCSSVPGMRRLAAERHQRERRERGEHRDERRGQVEAPVRAVGDHVLLADQLAEVGDRLQQAHRARRGSGRGASACRPISLRSKTVMNAKNAIRPLTSMNALITVTNTPSGIRPAPRSCRRRRPGRRPRRSGPRRRRACARACRARSSRRRRGAPRRAAPSAMPSRSASSRATHDLVGCAGTRAARCARPRRRRTAGAARWRAGPSLLARRRRQVGRARAPSPAGARRTASGARQADGLPGQPGEQRATTRPRRQEGARRARLELELEVAAGGGQHRQLGRARRAGARQHGAQALRAALEIRDRAVLLERGGRGQDDVRPERRRRREERARDDRLAALQRGLPALGLGEARERVGVAEHDEHLQRARPRRGAAPPRRRRGSRGRAGRARSGPSGTASTPPGPSPRPAACATAAAAATAAGSVAISTGCSAARSASRDLARGDAPGRDVVEVAAAAAGEQQARAAAHGLAHAQLEHARRVADLALARRRRSGRRGRARRCGAA